MMQDKHGNTVDIGDTVRVLVIAPEALASLAEDERPYIEGMLNNLYEIDEFPYVGKASVSICADEGDGRFFIGGLYLSSHEIELVQKAQQPSDA